MDNILEFEIPEELKTTGLPSPEEITYWKLRKDRVFTITEEVDDGCVELAKAIIQLNVEEINTPIEELKPIQIWIHTPGGDLDAALALCDVIESSRIPVITVCMGMAMSAGFLILLAGHSRYAFAHNQLLIHSGSASFAGTAEQMSSFQENYKKMLDMMKRYILEHTTIDERTFNKYKSRDWYVNCEDVEKYGIAKIIKSFAEIE